MSWNDKKQAILDESARLFSRKGYRAASIREIASAVGLANSSAIYFQFESKEDILNEIFNTFEHRLKNYFLTKEQVDAYIETDTPRRLLERCLQDFKPDEKEFMACAYRIACMEMMTNTRAKELIEGKLHKETADSIQYVLDSLIERGKIPAFETKLFSTLWAQFMFSEAVTWLSGISEEKAARITSPGFQESGSFLIDMAINGKIPSDSI